MPVYSTRRPTHTRTHAITIMNINILSNIASHLISERRVDACAHARLALHAFERAPLGHGERARVPDFQLDLYFLQLTFNLFESVMHCIQPASPASCEQVCILRARAASVCVHFHISTMKLLALVFGMYVCRCRVCARCVCEYTHTEIVRWSMFCFDSSHQICVSNTHTL